MPEIVINTEEHMGQVTITVTGDLGYGSGGTQHAAAIVAAIDNAIQSDSAEKLVIDLSGMQYEWGDAIGIIFHKYSKLHPIYRLRAVDSDAWNGLLSMTLPPWSEIKGTRIQFV